MQSCLEFSNYGFTELSCRQWAEAVTIKCEEKCSNCTQIGVATKAQCKFFLQTKSLAQSLIEKECQNSAEIMEKGRCPTYCDLEKVECFRDEAKACMAECGNYARCFGRKQRGTMQPDTYQGTTVLQGRVGDPADPDAVHGCVRMPENCKHHRVGSKCARYKQCELNLCIVKNVVCKSDNPCKDISSCIAASGKCLFRDRPNGDKCSDGLHYTTDDVCMDGTCVGESNECLKYNITCQPPGQCSGPGQCMSHTGRCSHHQLPDGTLCNDGYEHTLEDKCMAGICRGRTVDACADQACKALDQCHLPGECDALSGRCSHPKMPNDLALPCDDGDPKTSGDICIDGVCIGNRFATPKYQMLGDGECVDVQGRRMAQYYGDVSDEQVCRQTCSNDPQCSAYSYGFPMCRLYGTIRTSAPVGNWAFQLGHPSATLIEKATGAVPGARLARCWKKADAPNPLTATSLLEVEVDSLFLPPVMAGLFSVMVLFATAVPLLYKWKIKGVEQKPITTLSPANLEEENAPVPKNAWGEDQPELPDTVPGALPAPPKQLELSDIPRPEGAPPGPPGSVHP